MCEFMKLTIVTVVFNDLPGLLKTIASLSVLDRNDIEYWVIDGGGDGTVKKYLESTKWIKWLSEPDDGIYDAMNKGLDSATADYELFMNAGDCIHRDFSLDYFFLNP